MGSSVLKSRQSAERVTYKHCTSPFKQENYLLLSRNVYIEILKFGSTVVMTERETLRAVNEEHFRIRNLE